MSARDLTGAPLISLVPCKNRKVGGQAGQGPGQRKYYERQRHKSDQANIPSSYYAGQNLYQKLMVDRGYPYLQDFYQNPTFGSRASHGQPQAGGESSAQHHLMGARRDKLSSSKSFDNLSDTISVSSEEEDNFKPRIIRPRRRRKKEKRRGVGVGLSLLEQDESSCLGSETQWLPTGLLSAESESPDTRSDTATDTDTEDQEELEGNKKSKSAKRRTHRKLGGTLSVPTYPSFQLREYHSERTSIGSDYYSLTSSSSCSPNSPQSSSSDQLCDSDNGISATLHHPTLTASKSYNNNSHSYFRSPKLTQKEEVEVEVEVESAKKPGVKSRQLALRKTQSWAHTSSTSSTNNNTATLGEFSLWYPGKSIDLLSGIRKHLSRLDLNEEESFPDQQ